MHRPPKEYVAVGGEVRYRALRLDCHDEAHPKQLGRQSFQTP